MTAEPLFKVQATDSGSSARTGVLTTEHGRVLTPVFMPVGTQATVKALSNDELIAGDAGIILANAYHLYLRPGAEVIRRAGGLHAFMNWPRPILTDSGGFQIFSLSGFNRIRPEGIEFKSHLDGSMHVLSPEAVIDFQQIIGSDILMPLDECVRYPADRPYVEKSLELTADWARRSKQRWLSTGGLNVYGRRGWLFGIVQGGLESDLRQKAARQMTEMDFPAYALGGLSVGEPRDLMYAILRQTVPLLPFDKPRYAMGIGTPEDLFEAVACGIDMFDCVIPTRNGRHATVFTPNGRLLLRKAAYALDFGPIQADCPCYACRNHTRAYLHHLFTADEPLGGRLASLHNIAFFIELLKSMRLAIEQNRFSELRRRFDANTNHKE